MHQTTISKAVVDRVIAYGVARGCDGGHLESLITANAVDAEGLNPSVPVSTYFQVFDRIAKLLNDEDVGLKIYRDMDWADLGIIGFAYKSAATVFDAVKTRNRFYRLAIQNSTIATFDVTEAGRLTYTYSVLDSSLPVSRHDNDLDLSGVVYLVRDLSGEKDWCPKEVRFSHESPEACDEYEATFGCPISFNAPECFMEFPEETASLKVIGGDQRLYSILDSQLQRLNADVNTDDDTKWNVQEAVARELCNGVPAIEGIASELGMSSRSLQRRLADADSSFRSVIDDTRKRLACRYLDFTDYALVEIAFLLGYTELSAFIRAFRRWTGQTPQSYRQDRITKQLPPIGGTRS